MKARVYGWAENEDGSFDYMNGHICEIKEHKISDKKINITDSFGDDLVVHEKQIELIREITITEEDFNNAINNAFNNCVPFEIPTMFEKALKEELFKDVK